MSDARFNSNDFLAEVQSVNTADSSSVSNTTSETNFSTNYNIPANFFTAEKILKYRITGRVSTPDFTAVNASFRLKYGSTVLLSDLDIPLSSALSSAKDLPFVFEGYIVCRTAGASGTVAPDGIWSISSLSPPGTVTADSTITIDTTAATDLQLSVQFDIANANAEAHVISFIVESLN